MAGGIRSYSTTAANNNAATPYGWPEGQPPSSVNNVARQNMADLRAWYENPTWIDFGDTPTRVSNTVFTVATDLTARYAAGRRIQLIGATTGYATISSATYGAPDTTITVVMDSGNVPTSLTNVSVSALSLAPEGSDGTRRTAAEIAAGVTPTNYAYAPLNIRRYGGAPGAGDNTSAMDQAEAVCAQLGGGVIVLDVPGVWLMNWVCTTRGITVQGQNGQAEYDTGCVRPFSIASPPITLGDGTADIYYFSLSNLHISGTDGTANGLTKAANNAPYTLLLKGGSVKVTLDRVVLFNGVKTLGLTPSATNPVTVINVTGGSVIRNDIADSANARCIYGQRLADPGYLTSMTFSNMKLNGPGSRVAATLGYLAEFDGTANGITAAFTDVYCDIVPDFATPASVCHGILLKGASGLVCHNLQLDPGTTNTPVIETDQAQTAPSRFVIGNMRHGGQKMKFAAGALTALPAEADTYSYKALHQLPFIITPMAITYSGDPFDAAAALPFIDSDSTVGPVTFNRASVSCKTAGTGFRVKEGANCKQGTAVLVAGTVVVSTTVVTANSRIFLTSNTDGGTPGFQRVSARTAGTSFTITSSNAADTSTIAYQIFEPA